MTLYNRYAGLLFLFALIGGVVSLYMCLPDRCNVSTKNKTYDNAVTLMRDGKYAEARTAFQALCAKRTNCDALLGWAECSYYLKDDTDCITQVMAIRTAGAKEHYGRALLLRGLVHLRAGQKEQAKISFKAAYANGEPLAANELKAMGE